MKSNFIKEVNIINQKKNKITDFIGYEREAAIHDLISENFLRVKKNKFYSPLIMNLSLDNGMLEINIVDEKDQVLNINKSISGLKKIIQNYHLACSNYYDQIKNGSTENLQEVENLRRKIHNKGAEDLDFILKNDLEMDLNTSRRLFTLLYSLFI
ncbi:MAG: UPF0262 family protein [Alphaproteobacteria bacterium]|jgi:uncharacterized protein (UPF0262 family)|nr:UPF0262 family protein [Rhodobiaceae bacterium]MDC0184888.1 UPF0262 family protein [Rhodobiaceae bacterium]|tara:strand:+ start:6835 stop:7299 length:465 start_codon:yes stop_codon:yes gene_type:complete